MVTEERGQVLLVGAVVLAVTLVAIVALLNGVAYTEHVGGGEQDSYEDAKRVEESLTRDLDAMSASVADGGVATDGAKLDTHADRIDEHYTEMVGASHAATVDVSFSSSKSTTATAIVHDSGDMTPDGSSPPLPATWEVVKTSNPKPIKAFTMSLDPLTIPTGSPGVRVQIGGPTSPTATIPIWKDGSGEIHVAGCAPFTPGSSVDIDFVAGEIEGTSCTFSTPLSSPPSDNHYIRYQAATSPTDYPEGSYRVVLDGTYPSVSARSVYSNPGSGPDVEALVTEAAFDLTYETPSMTYESTIEVEVDD